MNIVKTLHYLRPNEEWALSGNSYSGLVWISKTQKPTEAELLEAWATLEPLVLWEPIREKRDNLLSQSDWTQLSDVQVGNKSQWAEYRQKLRDITKDFQNPQEVVWPVKPS